MRKYVNLHVHPVCLPDGRGGQITFRKGQGSFSEWFSRFVGPGKLSVINVNVDKKLAQQIDDHRKKLIESKKNMPVFDSIKVGDIPFYKEVADAETQDYKLVRGIYHCKKCDMFRTGSLASLKAHFANYHAGVMGSEDGEVVMTSKESVSSKPIKDDEESVMTTTNPDSKQVVDELLDTRKSAVDSVLEKIENEQGEDVVEEEVEQYPCDVPGCGKVFTSNRGLLIHRNKIHGNTKDS